MAIGAAVFALFPTMSDADFVVYDPVLHGASLDRVLESGNDPAGILTHPNHPLFHQLTYLIARPLRSLEVERPALVASRILNGIGMAVIVLVISSLAGPRRWLVGFGFALLAIACRGVILDAGTGENIIPGAAAALLALRLASGAGSHPRVLVFTILVALLLRQDNLFIVPGCLLAHAMKNPAGRRLRSAMVVAFAAGTLTLAAYAIIYALCPWDRGFIDFLLGLGARGSWSTVDELGLSASAAHFASLGWCIVGRFHEQGDAATWAQVLGWFAVAGGAAWCLRGDATFKRPLAAAVTLTLLLRTPFYMWFEPENWEWHVLPLLLIAAVAASWCRGVPTGGRARRRAGGCLLVTGITVLLTVNARSCGELRDRTLYDAARKAVEVGGIECLYVTVGHRLNVAFATHGLRSQPRHDPPALPFPADLRTTLIEVVRHAQGLPGPTMVVIDRFLRDGMPHTLRNLDRFDVIEDLVEGTPHTVVRHDGRIFAIGFRLP